MYAVQIFHWGTSFGSGLERRRQQVNKTRDLKRGSEEGLMLRGRPNWDGLIYQPATKVSRNLFRLFTVFDLVYVIAFSGKAVRLVGCGWTVF